MSSDDMMDDFQEYNNNLLARATQVANIIWNCVLAEPSLQTFLENDNN